MEGSSRFNRTKELIIREMGLLVLCTSLDEAEQILYAIFIIIISEFDGDVLQSTMDTESVDVVKTPCAEKKSIWPANIQ